MTNEEFRRLTKDPTFEFLDKLARWERHHHFAQVAGPNMGKKYLKLMRSLRNISAGCFFIMLIAAGICMQSTFSRLWAIPFPIVFCLLLYGSRQVYERNKLFFLSVHRFCIADTLAFPHDDYLSRSGCIVYIVPESTSHLPQDLRYDMKILLTPLKEEVIDIGDVVTVVE